MGIAGKIWGACLIGAGAVASAIGSNKLTEKTEKTEKETPEKTEETKTEDAKEETTDNADK